MTRKGIEKIFKATLWPKKRRKSKKPLNPGFLQRSVSLKNI